MIALFLFLIAKGVAQEEIDLKIYQELKREYERHVSWYYHDARVSEEIESFLKERMQWQLEYSLTETGTPEALYLLSKYQALDWDLSKMWAFHLALDP